MAGSDQELGHYDLLLRSMEEGLLVGVNRDDQHHPGTDELRVVYSSDDRTEVQLKRGFEDYVELHRDRNGDLVLSEIDDEIGLRKEVDVVTIEIMGIGSDPADVSPESDDSGQSGLFQKYEVYEDDEPVEDCFVLEPESDPAARHALSEYARRTEDKELANDLRHWVDELGDQQDGDRYE